MKSMAILAATVLGVVSMTAAAAKTSRVSDGDLLGALKIINDGEIAEGNSALATSTNQDVKDFGQEMVDDHTAANQKLDQFVANQHVSPSEGMLALKFRAAQAKERAMSTVLRGQTFDRRYLDDQIQGHQKVLAMLKQQNGGRSSEMNQLLTQTEDMVAQHMQEAKLIRQKLS